ncbi:GNAT family N-acetyltransferase [Ruminococcus albus]|uniref:Diamine N-acetyltransferase n=1 Tax=Ruminococcus albus TaxID=1264 RepID=A0A1I1DP62_RUMAL|nr:GNAT family N-acetyltransferase [Ruminococcus albus]SFB76206.1 diamine N-acetyltransferase [Ruminococcus albus]
MVELRPVDKNNIDDVLALEVHDYQKSFVSTVAESLAQAYVYSDNAYPFAVYNDDEIVGFIMMGYYEVKQYYTLWKFLIDKKHQNKGYGRQALALGIKFLKDKFDVDSVYTGVVPGNAVASRLYRSVGFVPTGLIEFGMEELRLECE